MPTNHLRRGFLLLGSPGETRESVEERLAFADSLNLDALKVTLGVRIYPETPLAATALAEGMIRLDDDLPLCVSAGSPLLGAQS